MTNDTIESEAVRDELGGFWVAAMAGGDRVRTALGRRRLGRKIVRTFNYKHCAKGYPVIYPVLLSLNGGAIMWIMGLRPRSNEQPQGSRLYIDLMDDGQHTELNPSQETWEAFKESMIRKWGRV